MPDYKSKLPTENLSEEALDDLKKRLPLFPVNKNGMKIGQVTGWEIVGGELVIKVTIFEKGELE